MKTSFFGAMALVLLASGASAQQYYTTSYYAVNVATPQAQPHLHTYNSAQGVYGQPQAGYYLPDSTYVRPSPVYTQPSTIYVQRPHHKPTNLAGYWPFISKAHSDRDFDRNWIHVYGGR